VLFRSGGTLDDFNRHFSCSNRNPIMFSVMPLAAVKRNPLAGITVGHEDIQPPGAPVYPLALSHTTSAAHAGTHTAACGIGLYRGDLMPDLAGNVFVCDPTGQLVTRNRLVPNGASFTAERVGEKRDFLVSADEWSRPVNVRNGPDGALYVVDMYRRFIDHARFFPEDFAKSHYMRAGFDQGRIWRLAPKGSKPAPAKALPTGDTARGAQCLGDCGPEATTRAVRHGTALSRGAGHARTGRTPAGVNGLFDMGGNAWEWVDDAPGAGSVSGSTERRTRGGSWWYGTAQMQAEHHQAKPADTAVVYIGFRCARSR
jgi:hypothetical protein